MENEGNKMDEYALQVLKASLVTSFRQDDAVARQAVINHQASCQLMLLSFIRDATEMSIPESYAVQGLANAQTTREAPVQNLAARTPSAA